MGMNLEAKVGKMKSSPWTTRAWDTSVLQPIFEEVRENLKRDPDFYQRGDG